MSDIEGETLQEWVARAARADPKVTFTAPCEHCGCPHAPWFELDTTDEDNFQDYVECQHCHARTPSFDDPDDAVGAWESGNTAVPEWALPMIPWLDPNAT